MNTSSKESCDIAIIGAGITGLTLAYRLQQAGLSVLVLEKRASFGGVIRSEQQDGYLFDAGPNSTLDKGVYLSQLVAELGLEQEMVVANEQAANRFIVRNGKLHKLPLSLPAFIKSRLLSTRAKARILGELLVRPKRGEDKESVADFVQRRLGREFLTYVINPFVAGVYASDPAQLNVQAAFPKLKALEQEYGGLIRGAIAKQQQKKKNAGFAGPSGKLISFREGMQALPRALVHCLGNAFRSGTMVEQIRQETGAFVISAYTRSGERLSVTAARLVLACPAPVTARLIAPLDTAAALHLEKIPYAPVAVIFHGYKKEKVPHPLDGFGFLVPAVEKRNILGTIWSSSLFPGRAPEGSVALTTFVGGSRQPDLLALADKELELLVRNDLRELLGIDAAPDLLRLMRWDKAIPQYTNAQPEAIRAVEKLEAKCRGLYIAGNFRGGVSVADCVESAFILAQKIVLEFTYAGEDHGTTTGHSEAAQKAAALAP